MTRIVTVEETGSTNADLRALAQAGGEEGLWLRARRQTAGRGRQGRAWMSPEGNLYASTLTRLRPGDPAAASLAFVAAVALWETVAALSSVEPGALRLKWPNDLLLGEAKVAGILLEREADAVIAGFGVNLADAPDLPDRATAAVGAIDAAAMVALLAERFAAVRASWRRDGLGPILRAWTTHAHPRGTPLAAGLPDGERVDGVFERLGADGALILRLADGTTRAIHAGDVFLV